MLELRHDQSMLSSTTHGPIHDAPEESFPPVFQDTSRALGCFSLHVPADESAIPE